MMHRRGRRMDARYQLGLGVCGDQSSGLPRRQPRAAAARPYVPRVGAQSPRTYAAEWKFHLKKIERGMADRLGQLQIDLPSELIDAFDSFLVSFDSRCANLAAFADTSHPDCVAVPQLVARRPVEVRGGVGADCIPVDHESKRRTRAAQPG